jgi:hypothetical protein
MRSRTDHRCWGCGLLAPAGVCSREHGPGMLWKGRQRGMVEGGRSDTYEASRTRALRGWATRRKVAS